MSPLKKRIVLSLGGLLLLLLLLFVLIIVPSALEIIGINQQIYLQRQELEEKFLAGQSLRKTMADLAEVQQVLPQLYSLFIREDKELDFITTLEKISRKETLNQRIELDNNAENLSPAVKSLPLRLFLGGNFKQFIGYLAELQRMDYYYNPDTLVVSNPEAAQKSRTLTGSKLDFFLGSKVYWLQTENNLEGSP